MLPTTAATVTTEAHVQPAACEVTESTAKVIILFLSGSEVLMVVLVRSVIPDGGLVKVVTLVESAVDMEVTR